MTGSPLLSLGFSDATPPVLYLWVLGAFLAWGASRLARQGRGFRFFAIFVACALVALNVRHELTLPFHEEVVREHGWSYIVQRMAAYCLPVVAALCTRPKPETPEEPKPRRLRPEDLYPDPTRPPGEPS